jgi:hypothetical protein
MTDEPTPHNYEIFDGAIKLGEPGTKHWDWAATVKDPAAPQPDFAFLRYCPGGFIYPGFAVGDVIAWGGSDVTNKYVGHGKPNTSEKGYLIKKYGPFYRLVIAVTPERITAVKCGYEAARRMRKELLASSSAPSANPLALFSDDEILAEFVRRGLPRRLDEIRR